MNTGQIIKSKSAERYTVISNEIIKSKTLTIEEKGLLAFLLSLPSDWVIYKLNLYESLPDLKGTIDRVFSSLQEKGFIVSVRVVNSKGQFIGWNHVVYDSPTSVNVEVGQNVKPIPMFTEVGESVPILNTDSILNTELTNNGKGQKPPNQTPEEKIKNQKIVFFKKIISFISINPNKYPKLLYYEFCRYWTEPNGNGKMRYQKEQFFEMGRRLSTWFKNSKPEELTKQWEAENSTETVNKLLAKLL